MEVRICAVVGLPFGGRAESCIGFGNLDEAL